MALSLSNPARLLAQSDIRSMSIECDKVKGINLSQGICDIETPLPVLAGAKEAIDKGLNYYTRYDGIHELREEIAKKLLRHNGIDADPESNIIVSAGATGALFCSALALLAPGDEVILFEPYYSYHLHTLLAIGAKPVFVRTRPPDWSFSQEELEKAVSKKTRAILINTPSNPSGKVFGRGELKAISEVCVRHDLIVFTDEIYEYFVYDGLRHTSPASLPDLKDRTVTISGYSKTFSITGWRVGYCECRSDWAEKIGHINDLVYVCAPSPLQAGAASGLASLPESFYREIGRSYQAKRDETCAVLREVGLEPFMPRGAYYVLVDASGIAGKDSAEKAMNLLRRTGVASVPGRAFYHDGSGERMLRFCFAKENRDLTEAYRRLRLIGGEGHGKKI